MVEMSVAMNQTIGIEERSGLALRRSVMKMNNYSQDMSKNIPFKAQKNVNTIGFQHVADILEFFFAHSYLGIV